MQRSLSFLMTPVGSSGDVHPYVGIGRELRRRGHDVTVLTSEPFQGVIERSGLRFVSTASTEEFDRLSSDPDLWHPQRGLHLVLQVTSRYLRTLYQLLSDAYEPGRTVLVGHALGFATRVFEEVHRVPAVTLQLAPSVFRSDYGQPAYLPGRDLSSLPVWMKRSIWWALDRFLLDPHIVPELNRWRTELGLPPVSRVFQRWLHSPQCVIGLFPDWYSPRQPDWPRELHLTGFPLWDEGQDDRLDDRLEDFLAAGDPPIVFTPGSAHRRGERFFTGAIEAATLLGRRAVLATRYSDQIPAKLPASVCHVAYAPFARLLPRAAAVVHHGGIGSAAQGLAAGIPQLTMPMGFDQPDNVTKLQRLGVADWILPKRFTGRQVAGKLRRLLEDGAVAEACRRCAARIAAARPIEDTCDIIERAALAAAPSAARTHAWGFK